MSAEHGRPQSDRPLLFNSSIWKNVHGYFDNVEGVKGAFYIQVNNENDPLSTYIKSTMIPIGNPSDIQPTSKIIDNRNYFMSQDLNSKVWQVDVINEEEVPLIHAEIGGMNGELLVASMWKYHLGRPVYPYSITHVNFMRGIIGTQVHESEKPKYGIHYRHNIRLLDLTQRAKEARSLIEPLFQE